MNVTFPSFWLPPVRPTPKYNYPGSQSFLLMALRYTFTRFTIGRRLLSLFDAVGKGRARNEVFTRNLGDLRFLLGQNGFAGLH